jgi:FKBP-type peptidyl-prolyl cis-trans isomerase
MRLIRVLPVVLSLLGVVPALHAQREKLPSEDLEMVERRWPKAQKTSTGLRFIVLREGQGHDQPKPGTQVSVLYKGMLLDDTVFDEVADPQHPFQFRVGRGEVIEGWDQALQHMKKGEKRLWIIPYELGYGSRGSPPRIPRKATLVFEIELVGFEPTKG